MPENIATVLRSSVTLPAGSIPVADTAGEGIKIRQITATASTGTNFGWLLATTLV